MMVSCMSPILYTNGHSFEHLKNLYYKGAALGVLAPTFENVSTNGQVDNEVCLCSKEQMEFKELVRLFGGRDRYFRYESRREIHTRFHMCKTVDAATMPACVYC